VTTTVSSKRLWKPPIIRNDDFFYMDGHQQNKTRIGIKVDNKKDGNCSQIWILHHNVQGLKKKKLELTILLQLDLNNVDILCFTEHWLKEEHIGLINIDHFKLVSTFSRISSARCKASTYTQNTKTE
jgi:hypothetical protein